MSLNLTDIFWHRPTRFSLYQRRAVSDTEVTLHMQMSSTNRQLEDQDCKKPRRSILNLFKNSSSSKISLSESIQQSLQRRLDFGTADLSQWLLSIQLY